MIKRSSLIISVLIVTNLFAQENWRDLGFAEKVWVLLHPFSVKNAVSIVERTKTIVDSIQLKKNYPNTISGGEVDALRHAIGMALLSNRIGIKKSLWLGKAHEKKNKRDFKKKRLEDGELADSVSIQMDLFNNEIGANIGSQCKNCNEKLIIMRIIEAIQGGELMIVRMTKIGESLDFENNIIPSEQWRGKWNNSRVLVPSNYNL